LAPEQTHLVSTWN